MLTNGAVQVLVPSNVSRVRLELHATSGANCYIAFGADPTVNGSHTVQMNNAIKHVFTEADHGEQIHAEVRLIEAAPPTTFSFVEVIEVDES